MTDQIYNLFMVYAINLNIENNQTIFNYFINECKQQKTNNLIINYNDKTINIIFNVNDDDDTFMFYIFKEDSNLYITYDSMIPKTILYSQTDIEKDEFIDFLNYLKIEEEPFLHNFNYMN
jgi:hypothetical protein